MTKKRGAGRKPLPADERKGRVIQARVPEGLGDTLEQVARRHRVSVSQLIRDVLADTFELVESVVTESRNLGETAGRNLGEVGRNLGEAGRNLGEAVKRDAKKLAQSARGAERARKTTSVNTSPPPADDVPVYGPDADFADVEAWQEVLVNRGTLCARCGRNIPRGKTALFGILSSSAAGPRPWLCRSCGSQL